MSMMILKIQEGAEFDYMPSELQKAITRAGVVWPESRLLGTSPIDGYQLILINAKVDGDTLEQWMNVEYPTGELDESGQEIKIGFNLGWEVMAEEGRLVDQSILLPYFDDEPVFDEEGNVVGSEPVTDLTDKLQHWAGKRWTY